MSFTLSGISPLSIPLWIDLILKLVHVFVNNIVLWNLAKYKWKSCTCMVLKYPDIYFLNYEQFFYLGIRYWTLIYKEKRNLSIFINFYFPAYINIHMFHPEENPNHVFIYWEFLVIYFLFAILYVYFWVNSNCFVAIAKRLNEWYKMDFSFWSFYWFLSFGLGSLYLLKIKKSQDTQIKY